MSAFTINAAKVFVVIGIATSVTGPIFGDSLLSFFGKMSDGISNAVSGSSVTSDYTKIPGNATFDKIDSNLMLMQAGLSAIKSIDTAGNQPLRMKKTAPY